MTSDFNHHNQINEGKHPMSTSGEEYKVKRAFEDNDATQWGVLKPIFGTKAKEIMLRGKSYSINKQLPGNNNTNSIVDCCFNYDEDTKKGNIEVTSQLGCVYVNQKPVRKGRERERVTLEDGNEIGFYFSETLIFKFYYYDARNLHDSPDLSLSELPTHKAFGVTSGAPTKTAPTPSVEELVKRMLYSPSMSSDSTVWNFVPPKTKQALLDEFKFCLNGSGHVHEKFTKITSLSRTLLLTAPQGAELFLQRLLKQIADELQVPLLEIDCTLLGAVDGVEQECYKNFQVGDRVKYIGKGKASSEEQLGKIGTVLFVAEGKVAVNFESNSNEHSGAFVEVDLLGGVDEEVPTQDRRLVGRLPEIIREHPRIIIVLQKLDEIFQTSKTEDTQEIRTIINDYRNEHNGILVGCSTNLPPPKSSRSKAVTSMEQGMMMYSEKDPKGMDSYGVKGNLHATRNTHKNLVKMFGNNVTITAPTADEARGWWLMMQQDAKELRAAAARRLIKAELAKQLLEVDNIESDGLDAAGSKSDAEKIVGWALATEVKNNSGVVKEISKNAIDHALSLQKMLVPVKDAVDLLEAENEFEKKLMCDVVRAADVDVSFDDIGALETVKETLYESITLPLLRPELFRKGMLTKRSKGILFFGPPGTGKTMLAKAVALESKANFINASLSSLESKWFGEAEKFVKALFSLAAKLSPCVIFIDEVDALLGKRTSQNENETLRKMKNEFMTLWDGLKSQNLEQIVVLGATNRPYDLDDAILRRFSRRILVDLPTKDGRINILNIILKNENCTADVKMIAEKTPGYSGCDLFNLCCAAAMRPVREYLKSETKDVSLRVDLQNQRPKLRPINDEDFLEVLTTMNPSTNKDSPFLAEIKSWNEQYGEGVQSKSEILPYFI